MCKIQKKEAPAICISQTSLPGGLIPAFRHLLGDILLLKISEIDTNFKAFFYILKLTYLYMCMCVCFVCAHMFHRTAGVSQAVEPIFEHLGSRSQAQLTRFGDKCQAISQLGHFPGWRLTFKFKVETGDVKKGI